MSGPVTLGDLIARQAKVWGYCLDCCREREIPSEIIALPKRTPVPDIGARMRCSNCRGRRIETKPELYPGGLPAMRMR